MFSFDHLTRVATAAVGALILSTLSIAAAVGPPRWPVPIRLPMPPVHNGSVARGNHKPVQVVVRTRELVRMKAPGTGTLAPISGSAKPYVTAKEFFPMGIFSRTRDIIAANVTDLLDKAEDPAKMIRMIILEMGGDPGGGPCPPPPAPSPTRRNAPADRQARPAPGQTGSRSRAGSVQGPRGPRQGGPVRKQKAADMADQLKAEIEVLDDARASEADISKLQNKLREARARQNAIMTRMESAQNAPACASSTPAPRSTTPSRASTCSSAAPTWPRAMPTR